MALSPPPEAVVILSQHAVQQHDDLSKDDEPLVYKGGIAGGVG